MRKWLPAALIAAAYVLSALVYRRLDPAVPLDLRALLPGALDAGAVDLVPRAAAALGLPTLALALWALLYEAPVSPAGRLAARLFPGAAPLRFELFAPSYRLMVLWVVALVVALHVAVLAGALAWPIHAGRLVGLTFGVGLMVVGNVMPRLRPNAVAGIRTARTMRDPAEWARAHRIFGAVWLGAGLLTTVVALAAPSYALLTGVLTLALSSLAGLLLPRAPSAPVML